MAAVPFDTMELRYSPTHRSAILTIEDAFDLVVVRGRGGLCPPVHLLFAELLKYFGFSVYCTGARCNSATDKIGEVTQATGTAVYGTWSHVRIIVEIGRQNYLVDTMARQLGSPVPIPLVHDAVIEDMPSRQCRMLYAHLPGSAFKQQKWWRKQLRVSCEDPGVDVSCFQETEWQTQDTYVMLSGLQSPGASWLSTHVICLRYVLEEERTVGYMYVWQDELRQWYKGKMTVLQKFYCESDGTRTLSEKFGITLSGQEKKGIAGWVSELKGDKFDCHGV